MDPPPSDDFAASRRGLGHVPVLLDEVLGLLDPKPGGRYCDATVGRGGHARAILERSGPDGHLVGIDRDPDAVAGAQEELASFGARVSIVKARFSQAREVLDRLGMVPVDGFLVDLGVSSPQLDDPARGFSFRADGPLDMRMDPTEGESAAELLRRVDEEELTRIIREYGEERYAARVARAIVDARRTELVETTGKLATLVARALPRHERHKNPATRTFQALRIAVNGELDDLDRFLAVAADCLRPGGRLCVIAFHSLEDRIVKRRFRALAGKDGAGPAVVRLLTKHVVVAAEPERLANPRSRSAKLRAAERL
jgi:16S rRNA (cytosine1402-N4)-methyltransferase